VLELPERLRAIVAQEYPRFSDAEYARRHRALQGVMEAAGVDHLLIVTDHRTGNAPQWVTGWPGTVEAYAIFRLGRNDHDARRMVQSFPAGKETGPGLRRPLGRAPRPGPHRLPT